MKHFLNNTFNLRFTRPLHDTRNRLRTIKLASLAAVVMTGLLAGANAQTTSAPALTSLPREATAAHTQVIRDLATLIGNDVTTLKAAVATLETNKAAGLSVAAHVTAVETARAQLRTDQQALSDAAKAYFSAARVSMHADQVQLKVDVAAALKTPTLTADKAAVDAAEVKVRLDIALNDTEALAVDKAALDDARRQLVADRSAALAASLAVTADRVALAAARQTLQTDRAAVKDAVGVSAHTLGLGRSAGAGNGNGAASGGSGNSGAGASGKGGGSGGAGKGGEGGHGRGHRG